MRQKASLWQKNCVSYLKWGYPDGLALVAASQATAVHTPCELVLQGCQPEISSCSLCNVVGTCSSKLSSEILCEASTSTPIPTVGAACSTGGGTGTCQASGVCQVGSPPPELQHRPWHVGRRVLGWQLSLVELELVSHMRHGGCDAFMVGRAYAALPASSAMSAHTLWTVMHVGQ